MKRSEAEHNSRERLILAGINELGEHGISDFSLRRVAAAAQLSCAAPYRHFRDKDELILAIISYIRKDWLLLCDSISTIYRENPTERLLGLCAAAVRFWIGNGSFYSVLLATSNGSAHRGELSLFDTPIIEAVAEVEAEKGRELPTTAILAMLYGTVSLICSGRLSANKGQEDLRNYLTLLVLGKILL